MLGQMSSESSSLDEKVNFRLRRPWMFKEHTNFEILPSWKFYYANLLKNWRWFGAGKNYALSPCQQLLLALHFISLHFQKVMMPVLWHTTSLALHVFFGSLDVLCRCDKFSPLPAIESKDPSSSYLFSKIWLTISKFSRLFFTHVIFSGKTTKLHWLFWLIK